MDIDVANAARATSAKFAKCAIVTVIAGRTVIVALRAPLRHVAKVRGAGVAIIAILGDPWLAHAQCAYSNSNGLQNRPAVHYSLHKRSR